MKLRIVRFIQRYLANPPVKLMFRLGTVPPGYALLETIGRKSGQPRVTPVGDGLSGSTFWIVAEHGADANYVRNITANPAVRVRVRQGLRTRWITGTAHVLPEDDPRARQQELARTSVSRRLNAVVVRLMGTDLLTVRVDLDNA